ncbi:hypothetical protein AUK22_05035 [bacterium CG2_30_54_10]|nr:MAG: hypothetical protein AUK22_05035 [bacterium CG2_30_54_10]
MDPFAILEISPEADDKMVREAYFRKISLNPPDRNSKEFQLIRKAFEMIRDEEARLAFRLFWNSPPRTLAQMENDFAGEPVAVGPDPWLTMIAQARKK